MLREAIGIGETVEEAKENACKELGVEAYEVEIEVLQMPEKKKFGLFGGSPAKVRVYIELSPAENAAQYLKEILCAIGIEDINIEISEEENGAVLELEGENVGFVIGKRGETLDALQYLCGLVANHSHDEYYRITINVGNYREKRDKTLSILGRKLAFKAIKTRRNVDLEPMNPYERRIIHTAVQKVNGAISWSEGENINRHVVIGPDPNFKPKREYNKGGYNRNNYNRNGGRSYNKNRGYNSYNKIEAPSPTRPPINDGEDFSLYGKIETKKED